jgi:hypothetical protein
VSSPRKVTDRSSYSRIIALPSWGLYRANGELVATIRAESAYAARDIFRRHGLEGARVRLCG